MNGYKLQGIHQHRMFGVLCWGYRLPSDSQACRLVRANSYKLIRGGHELRGSHSSRRYIVFVTSRAVARVLEAGPPPHFIECWCASFLMGPIKHILDPGSWIQDSGGPDENTLTRYIHFEVDKVDSFARWTGYSRIKLNL